MGIDETTKTPAKENKITVGLRDAIAKKGKSTRYVVHNGEAGQVSDQPVVKSVIEDGVMVRREVVGQPVEMPLVNALRVAHTAMHDWLATYADDMVGDAGIKEAGARIKSHGGMLAYISDVLAITGGALKFPGYSAPKLESGALTVKDKEDALALMELGLVGHGSIHYGADELAQKAFNAFIQHFEIRRRGSVNKEDK